MSKEYEIEIVGQPYFGRKKERTYGVYFSEPDGGINGETGILLLVAGFCGNANSNVYKKIRKLYADKYNMVVVQCDYMGSKFMQGTENYDIQDIIFDEKDWTAEEIEGFLAGENISQKRGKNLEFIVDLQESEDDFCEMGIFQAMDNIRALKVVTDIIEQNNLRYNKNKIVAFGDSHGAYLCYLINILCPNLLSLIIDNSAWVYPKYLYEDRGIIFKARGVELMYRIQYNIKRIIDDREIYDLRYLYRKFENTCMISAFHGVDDTLITIDQKEEFLQMVNNVKLYKVGADIATGEIFKNTEHSLGADYLKLLDYVLQNTKLELKKNTLDIFAGNTLKTDRYQYEVKVNDKEVRIDRNRKAGFSVYEKNIQALKKNSKEIWREVQKYKNVIGEAQVIPGCIQAKDGTDILTVTMGKKTYKLNSMYAPKKEAKSFAEDFQIESLEQIYMIYGLGNGIFIRELLERMQEGNMLLVYEPSVQLFIFVMENFDISDILKNNKFCLVVQGLNDKALYKVIEYSMGKVNGLECNMVALPYYTDIFKENYEKIEADLDRYKKDAGFMQNTILRLSSVSVKNSIRNLPYFFKSKGFNSLKEIMPRGVTAILVAAGPSLSQALPILKRAKGKSMIVAVERVLGVLMDHGIEPDFLATLDPIKPVLPIMREQTVEIPLFALPQTNTEFMGCHKGEKFITNNGGFYYEFRKQAKTEETELESGSSVATYISALLLELGVRRIVFVGQDLAFGTEGAYADKNNFLNTENPFGEYLKGEGVDGKTVYTRSDWRSFGLFLEEQIEAHPEVEFIDVKHSGLKIHGSKSMDLEQVIELYCNQELDWKEIVANTKDLFPASVQGEINKCMRQEVSEIQQGIDILQQIICKCKRGEKSELSEILRLSHELEEIQMMKYLNDLMLDATLMYQQELAKLQEANEMMFELMGKMFHQMQHTLQKVMREFEQIGH